MKIANLFFTILFFFNTIIVYSQRDKRIYRSTTVTAYSGINYDLQLTYYPNRKWAYTERENALLVIREKEGKQDDMMIKINMSKYFFKRKMFALLDFVGVYGIGDNMHSEVINDLYLALSNSRTKDFEYDYDKYLNAPKSPVHADYILNLFVKFVKKEG